jgi:hypothetical protein
MNDLSLKLACEAGLDYHLYLNEPDSKDVEAVNEFCRLVVKQCVEQIMLECEDFENGNVFGGKDGEELWLSVTREYGKEKQRGFNPIGIAVHLSKMINKKFGLDT